MEQTLNPKRKGGQGIVETTPSLGRGGMCYLANPLDPPTDPPHPSTHIRKISRRGQMKSIKGAGNLRLISGQ